MDLPAPGWRSDPTGRYVDRWWDGDRWTAQVRWGHGEHGEDPVRRPIGAIGSERPNTTSPADLPIGGRPRAVRLVVALGVALPLALLATTAATADGWVAELSDGIGAAVCERVGSDGCGGPTGP